MESKLTPSKDLPSFGLPEGEIAPVVRAGDTTEQRRLHAIAWDMVQIWRPVGGRQVSRLSAQALRARRWRVLLVPHFGYQVLEPLEQSVASALSALGADQVVSANVDPTNAQPSAVFRMPAEGPVIGRHLSACFGSMTLLFAEDSSAAIFADDGNYAAIAGPEAFVRAAAGPFAQPGALDAFLETRAALDGPYWQDVLAHHASFLLDPAPQR